MYLLIFHGNERGRYILSQAKLAPTGITVPCLVGATSSLRSTSFGNVPILFDRDLEVAPTGITLLLPGSSLLLYALCPMPYALCALQKISCQCGVFLYTGTSREVKSVDPFPAKNLPTQGVSPDHLAERVQTRLQ